jgi:hypothetical protein
MEDPSFRVIDFGRRITAKKTCYENDEKILARSALYLSQTDV